MVRCVLHVENRGLLHKSCTDTNATSKNGQITFRDCYKKIWSPWLKKHDFLQQYFQQKIGLSPDETFTITRKCQFNAQTDLAGLIKQLHHLTDALETL